MPEARTRRPKDQASRRKRSLTGGSRLPVYCRLIIPIIIRSRQQIIRSKGQAIKMGEGKTLKTEKPGEKRGEKQVKQT
jgi:hypothetical protein